MDNQAAMDKMFAQLAKSARIDVFKTSLDTMQEALEVSRKIREDEKKATDRNNAAQQKMLSSFASGLERQLSVSTKGLLKAQAKVQKALRTGNEAEMKIAQAEASRLSSVVSDIMKRSRESAKEIESYNKALEKSNEIFTQDLRDRREKVEELGKAGYIAQEVMLGSVKSSVDALKEGVSSLENMTEGVTGKLTKFFHKRAASFDQKASSATDPGKAKGFMQMAKTLGGVAKTLAVVGGSITILVSLFSMAEGAVKDMNKEILNSVSYTDLMAVSGDDVQDKFKTLRNLFTDGSFLDYLGMTSDELMALGGNLAQANLGMRALGGGKNGLELMRQAMTDIKTESLALGISLEDAVSRAENFAYEIGVSVKDGAFLRTMVNDFADIRDMAVQTGYSTANFYEKVKGLTDELDNMNLRTKEAGALFIRLARVVGPNGVSGLLSGTASLKGEDYLEQIKRQMLTDKKKTQGILEAEAQRSASSLLATFGENGAGMAMLQKAGLDTGSNQGLVASMQKMSTKDRQALLGELAMSQDTAGLGVELAKAFDVARGSAKGASRTDRSRAFDSMGAGAGLAMQYARLETHLGGRNLSDMSDIQKKAMMEFTDLSKEQLEQFGRMQDTYKGQFRSAQDLASKGSLTEDEGKKLSAMGLEVKGGKLVTKDTGIEVKDIAGFILAQSESIDKTKESTLTQEELLSQNVVATVSLADRINKYLGEILMDISSGIMDLVNAFFGGESETEETKKNKRKAEDIITQDLEKLMGIQGERRKRLAQAEADLKIAKGPDKEKKEKEIAALKAKIEEGQKGAAKLKAARGAIMRGSFGGDTVSVDDLLAKGSYQGMRNLVDTGRQSQVGGVSEKTQNIVEAFNKKFGTKYRNVDALIAGETNKNMLSFIPSEKHNIEGLSKEEIEKRKEKADFLASKGAQVISKMDRLKSIAGTIESNHGLQVGGKIVSATTGQWTDQDQEMKYALEDVRKQIADSQDEKTTVKQARAEAKDSTVKRAKQQDNTHLAEEIVKAEKRDKLRSLASNLGVQYGEDAGASTIADKINKRGFGTEQLMGYGYSKAVLRELGIKVENVNDGLFTGGKMYRFDQKDDILAMKPGGAVSQLGGGTINATINVNGAGDPEAVGRVVMREMENLNKRMRGGAK